MRLVTNQLINDFKIVELHTDFMGYIVPDKEDLSFHHLILSREFCRRMNVPEEGYFYSNGCILKQTTSHNYYHLIQEKDPERACEITSEIIDQKIKGKLDIDNLKQIREILLSFEKEYCSTTTRKGYPLIKEQYLRERIKL